MKKGAAAFSDPDRFFFGHGAGHAEVSLPDRASQGAISPAALFHEKHGRAEHGRTGPNQQQFQNRDDRFLPLSIEKKYD